MHIFFKLIRVAFFSIIIHTSHVLGDDCVQLQVTAQQLNIRSHPSTTGTVIDQLQKNDIVCAYSQTGNWIQIKKGWVSAKYLTPIQQQPQINSSNTSVTKNPQSANTNISTTVNNNVTSVQSNMNDEIAVTIFVLLVAIYVVMLLVGMAGKAVVYYDEADLVISLLPWLILFVTLLIAGIYQPTEQDMDPDRMLLIQKIVWYIGGALAFAFSIWSILLSIRYNKSVLLGLPYGIFKLLSGLIGVLVLISQVFTMKDEKTKRKDFWFAILVFGAFWWLGKKLINGKKVYKNNAWTIAK
jgi:hypothetical protein